MAHRRACLVVSHEFGSLEVKRGKIQLAVKSGETFPAGLRCETSRTDFD